MTWSANEVNLSEHIIMLLAFKPPVLWRQSINVNVRLIGAEEKSSQSRLSAVTKNKFGSIAFERSSAMQ